jgi:hypothetical protein
MGYLLTIDSNQKIVELFCDAPGYAAPPPDAVAISDADGEQISKATNRGDYNYVNGQLVFDAIGQLERDKNTEIDAAYKAAIGVVSDAYPSTERDSWTKQDAEARAWTADHAAVTPFLTALAAARGIPIADLAAKVLGKADAYVVYAAQTIGRRQARQDAIAAAVAANDLSALQAVVW